MTGIWETLGIEETTDLKTIKKAYAKRLKLNRPDEKPEEFKELHQAYKYAQQYARSYADEHHNNSLAETGETLTISIPQNSPTASDIIENEEEGGEKPVSRWEASVDKRDLNTKVDAMMEQVEQLMKNKERYKHERWKFLAESEFMLDPNFNWMFGVALFNRIAKYYNDQEYRKNGDFRLSIHVLVYLDSLFGWRDNHIDMLSKLDDAVGLQMFKRLIDDAPNYVNLDSQATNGLRGGKHVKEVPGQSRAPLKRYYYGSGVKRLAAMVVDLFLLSPVVMLISWLREPLFDSVLVTQRDYVDAYIMFGLYLVGAWLLECSSYQATPGKFVFGLRVANGNQQRLPYYHGFIRIIIFAMTCLGSYITMLINSWLGGNFIHDRLTRSYVIDYRRSRKEQRH